jgi:predicted secreted hydrolase
MNSQSRIHSTLILFLSIAILIAQIFCPPVHARVFEQALPGYHYSFPRDHYSHDSYKTEWWYFTGHLHADDGRLFGYELTFFRTGLNQDDADTSPWNLRNIYLAHFAVTDDAGHKFFYQEKLNRAGLGSAGAAQDKGHVFNQTWSMDLKDGQFLLKADTPQYALNLALKPDKPPVVHGHDGVSQKASCKGCASHYYSFTRMATTGSISVDGHALPVHGTSWMDHEFGSNQLTDAQVGWDWFSVQLSNHSEIMLYLMRNADGSIDKNSSGTLVRPDGSVKHLMLNEFSVKRERQWKSPKTAGVYPMGWTVSIPAADVDLKIEPIMQDQELATNGAGVTYWEGACSVAGKCKAASVTGEAYVELTGYAEKFHEKI